MIRATAVVRRPAVRAEKVADEITLDHLARHRRRFAMTGDGGTAFLLDLDKATVLDDGDAVKLEDGRLVRIKAAPEELVEVTTVNPLRLMKVAWHLGNRHVPAEITESAVYFVDDHVLTEMVRGLGAAVTKVVRPFRPEKGAYEAAEAHGGHGHDAHDHAHEHSGHEHSAHEHHDHSHAHHEHGADCACGHDHGHHDHGHHDHVEAKPAHSEHGHVHGPGCGHDHKHG
ncbi:urease accessory protein UreE [Xanthobacter dioxanivorans]|uniref:Urease accessory protein UreE n=1 Tax=Xanthobacter dioxanivorans TaxID=2528964 RepID=A0A974PLA0_9HYPH|nr:urease accessory protein UreE [Xanthobacter dioxanivorans]QRG05266.1 urease accessory protein UreE [Xanthobacter dioxanivorans]